MVDLRSTILQAVIAFAGTNVDDIVLLTVFYGTAGSGSRPRGGLAVTLGQYLGFGAILAASVLGAVGLSLLPERLVGLFGLLPLALGLRALWRLRRGDHTDPADHPATAKERSVVLRVAAVTFANGGDNIGVYAPLFATAGTARLPIFVVVFLLLVGVWCLAGLLLSRQPSIAATLERRGHLILPVVLIGLGVFILLSSGLLQPS